jgi:hypothetical protein|tara:strand:+ start:42 stop:761 length:720 start_codon:yes stop_codon:yes gene_type:complete
MLETLSRIFFGFVDTIDDSTIVPSDINIPPEAIVDRIELRERFEEEHPIKEKSIESIEFEGHTYQIPMYLLRSEDKNTEQFDWRLLPKYQSWEEELPYMLPGFMGIGIPAMGYAVIGGNKYRIRQNRKRELIPFLRGASETEKDQTYFKLGILLGHTANSPIYFAGLCNKTNYCITEKGEVKMWSGAFTNRKINHSPQAAAKSFLLHGDVLNVLDQLTFSNRDHKQTVEEGMYSVCPRT